MIVVVQMYMPDYMCNPADYMCKLVDYTCNPLDYTVIHWITCVNQQITHRQKTYKS